MNKSYRNPNPGMSMKTLYLGPSDSHRTHGPRRNDSSLIGTRDYLRAIQGHDVVSDGDRALQSTAERCRSGLPLTLRLEDRSETAIPCNVAPPSLPPPLAFPEI